MDIKHPHRGNFRLAGIEPSVGSRGDSYDKALAETIIGLYKTELIELRVRGANSRTSSSPGWNTSGGSATTACSSRSVTSLPVSGRSSIVAV
jgi:transposase InsO family protein